MDPKGKVILVTGASSGIGLASARALAHEGARVVLAARSLATLQAEAATIRAGGNDALAVHLDVADPASVERAVAHILDRLGHVDVAINFAGNGGGLGLWQEAPADQLRAMIDTHLLGAERVARALLPAMLQRGSGRIVNVASTVGWAPMPAAAAYSAAKAAVLAFSEALHGELRDRGIAVCVFAPPHTNTQAGRAWKMRGPRVFEPEWVAKQLVHALRTDQTSFLAGTSNRLLLVIRRLSPAYARFIMRRIGLQAISRKAA
jgi:NAD(P)-dependent dehydrogenase (short-subunit alcohol dehydrogenase family)